MTEPHAAVHEDYGRYVFSEVDDVERLVFQKTLYLPSFLTTLERVLLEYGLEERCRRGGVRVLDFGCAHGLYVDEVRRLLRRRGIAQGVRIDGIDLDADAIDYARRTQAAAPPGDGIEVRFANYDGTRPLDGCDELRDGGEVAFDFIYALLVLEHFEDARRQVARLYRYLKPGGVIYLRDFVMEEGEDGWRAPHPEAAAISARIFAQIPSAVAGVHVADEQADWLRSLGASDIRVERERVPVGGSTEHGRAMVRNWVLTIANAGRHLVAKGLVGEEELERVLTTLRAGLGPEAAGHATYVSTLARQCSDLKWWP